LLTHFSLGTTKIRYRLTSIVAKLKIKKAGGSTYHPVSLDIPLKTKPIIPMISNILPVKWNLTGTKPGG
jgi:hypothetical protein